MNAKHWIYLQYHSVCLSFGSQAVELEEGPVVIEMFSTLTTEPAVTQPPSVGPIHMWTSCCHL